MKFYLIYIHICVYMCVCIYTRTHTHTHLQFQRVEHDWIKGFKRSWVFFSIYISQTVDLCIGFIFWQLQAYIVHRTLIPKENPTAFSSLEWPRVTAWCRTWVLGHGGVLLRGKVDGQEKVGICYAPELPFPSADASCVSGLGSLTSYARLRSWITPCSLH